MDIKSFIDRYRKGFSHPSLEWEIKKAIQDGKQENSIYNRAIDILKYRIKNHHTGSSQNIYQLVELG